MQRRLPKVKGVFLASKMHYRRGAEVRYQVHRGKKMQKLSPSYYPVTKGERGIPCIKDASPKAKDSEAKKGGASSYPVTKGERGTQG